MAISKQERANSLVKTWVGSRSRKQMIEMIIKQMDVSAPHASTLYQNAKTKIKNEYLSDMNLCSDGFYRWNSSDRIPPQECLIAAGFSVDELARHKEKSDEETAIVLADYAKREEAFWTDPANEDAQNERLAEMRAAFGPGEKVVNVVTGKATQL